MAAGTKPSRRKEKPSGAKNKAKDTPTGKPAKKKRGPKKGAKRTGTKTAKGQASFLATVRVANPGITSDGFAELYKLDPAEVFRMRAFVLEYVKDFDPALACMRMGYPEDSALSTGNLYVINAYVQMRIDEWLSAIEIENIVTPSWVIYRLKQEACRPDVFGCSGSATRIAALRELAKILKLSTPAAPSGGLLAGGVMLVPLAVDPSEWENHAKQTQAALKTAVIDV